VGRDTPKGRANSLTEASPSDNRSSILRRVESASAEIVASSNR